jgi:hypothetical protein
MLRESELITELVQDPTWKRIDRLLPEATGIDGDAAMVALIGLAVVAMATVLAT